MMKTLLFALLGLLCIGGADASIISVKDPIDNCKSAYIEATNGYLQVKKSFKSYNLEHLKQYATRSVESIVKVEQSTKECGCKDANNAAYDAIQNLNMALGKNTFERSRNFIETAKANIQQIMISLDVCASGGDIDEIAESEGDLQIQEQMLLEQQQQLLERQKKLQDQLAKQKDAKAKLDVQKAEKIAAQKLIKVEAEFNLKELEGAAASLSKTMKCKKPIITGRSFFKSVNELENESLEATKKFYKLKAQEIANELINNLENCK